MHNNPKLLIVLPSVSRVFLLQKRPKLVPFNSTFLPPLKPARKEWKRAVKGRIMRQHHKNILSRVERLYLPRCLRCDVAIGVDCTVARWRVEKGAVVRRRAYALERIR